MLLSLLFAAGTLFAQMQSADLSGRVTAVDGTPIENANVSLVNVATETVVSTMTNRYGRYLFTGLAAGEYRLIVQKFGFKVSTRSNLQLHMQSQISENIFMELGYSNETVSSRATSWTSETSPASKTVLAQAIPEDLPFNGRSFEPLFWMVPGYVSAATYFTSPGQSSFNGRRTTENYITVDGASILLGTSQGNDVTLGEGAGESLPALTTLGSTSGFVSLDEIQEFTIQSNAYAPRFGHLPGAQVSILTRSGSETMHGAVFDYFRNNLLDASDWFTGYNHLPKSAETQHDFGGNLAGPLWRDRVFGFGSYEGMFLNLPQSRTEVVPTAAARERAPTALRALFNAFPLPNRDAVSDDLAVFAATPTDTSTTKMVSLRLDMNPSSQVSLFLRGSYAPSKATQRGAFDYYSMSTLGHTHADLNALTLGGTVRFNGSKVYEIRANVSNYSSGTWSSADDYGGAIPPTLGDMFGNYPAAARADSNFTTTFRPDNNGLYIGRDIENRQRQWNLTQEVSFPLRNHAITLGADVRWLMPRNAFRAYTGVYIFSGFSEAASEITTTSSRVQSSSSGQIRLLFRNISAYVQDTWRPAHAWNITYGLRWEGDMPPHDRGGNPLWNVTGLESPATLQLSSRESALWRSESANLAPRVGIGYEMRRNPGWETVARGNFGLYFGLASSAASRVAQGAPYLVSHALGATAYPLTTAQATPLPFEMTKPYSLIYGFPHDLRSPRVWEWNVGLEQHFGAHWMAIAEYVGSFGNDLLHRELLLPSENLNPDFTSIETYTNLATSNYQALQTRVARSFGNGVQLWANYTYSHSLDTASSLAHPSAYHVTYDPRMDYGSSDFDVRHSAALVATYNSTFNSDRAWLRRVLRDWSIASSLRARTGMPINVLTGSDLIPLGYTKSQYRRPDRVNGQPFYIHGSRYPGGRALNPAAFAANTSVLQGTLSRNAVTGFGVWQEDLSLTRIVPLHENLRLQLRVDAFNLFNHPSFGDPGSGYSTTNLLNSTSFGVSSATLAESLGHGGADGGYNPIYQIGGKRSLQLSVQVSF